jgi:hypothetical protein
MERTHNTTEPWHAHEALDRPLLAFVESTARARLSPPFVDNTAMVPNRYDIIGRWSENLGHTDDLSRDTVIQFTDEGVMNIVSADESINGRWECTSPGRLTMIMEDGHRYGPFRIKIEIRELPRGVFDVLESDGALLPFGRRRFTRIQ